MPGLVRLGVRNASRHPVRSVPRPRGLLASASFLVVAVTAAFHRDPGRTFLEKTGGSGGFAWIGESSVPIFEDSERTRTAPHWRTGDVGISCLSASGPATM